MSTTLPASAADVLLGRSMNFMRLQLITSCRETERCSRQHRMSSRSLVPAGGYPPDSNKTGEFDNGIDLGMVERVVVARDQLIITLAQPSSTGDMGAIPEIRCPWQANIHDSKAKVVSDADTAAHNESLIQSVVRSQAWIKSLREGAYDSIEMFAEANGLHQKSFASHSGSHSFRRTLRQLPWKADSRRDLRWHESRSYYSYAGTSIRACSADFKTFCQPRVETAQPLRKWPNDSCSTVVFYADYPALCQEHLLGAKGPGDDRRSHGATPAPFV
jgi:hypothetical protein